MNFGPTELIIVLIIVLLLFGTTRLPKLARSLGEASKEFKKGTKASESEDAKAADAKAAENTSGGDEEVTITRRELDALLAERASKTRQNGPGAAP